LNNGGPVPAPSTLKAAAAAVHAPDIPFEFPELAANDREALDELLPDQVVLLAFLHSLPAAQEMQQQILKKHREAADLARGNLQRQAELQELQALHNNCILN
jgi:hypothetical protein